MRPRPEEYLIRAQAGKAVRRIVWHCDKGLDLDLPRGWNIEKSAQGLRIRDRSNPDPKAAFEIPEFTDGETRTINLPPAVVGPSNRPLTLKLKKLRSPRPVYTNNPTLSALHTRSPKQLCVFYGQRYFLIRYRPVPASYTIQLGNQSVFDIKKMGPGFRLTAHHDNLTINVGGKKHILRRGASAEFTEVDFFRASVLQGVHWWRFRMVPTPDQQPPLETDESEEDLREDTRLHNAGLTFISLFAALLIGTMIAGKLMPPPAKVIRAEVLLKQPKVFPKFEEKKPPVVAKVEPPKPPPEPPPPVKKEKPPEVAKVKPKRPARKMTVAKKKPAPVSKPVARVEPPKPAPEPRIAPPVERPPEKIVKEEGPTPEQLRAIEKAKEQAAEKTQMLNSLNFLSTSKNRPAVEASAYESKEGKYSETPMVGGLATKSNVLDKMVKGAPGDGAITTKSGRSMASTNLKFGKGKGLNDVQGKVSLTELVGTDGNPGDALGGGKGLELSGPGELSESEIEKALAKFLSRFQYCYEKSLLTDSGLSGNLVVQWDVTVAGRADNSRVVKSQLNSKDLHACVMKVLGDVPFPKPKGGSVTVKKTFSFTSSSM